jgi:hypothetical protein
MEVRELIELGSLYWTYNASTMWLDVGIVVGTFATGAHFRQHTGGNEVVCLPP